MRFDSVEYMEKLSMVVISSGLWVLCVLDYVFVVVFDSVYVSVSVDDIMLSCVFVRCSLVDMNGNRNDSVRWLKNMKLNVMNRISSSLFLYV